MHSPRLNPKAAPRDSRLGRDTGGARYFIFQLRTSLMTYCAGTCGRYKAPRPLRMSRYAAGQKRCNYCSIFINYDGLNCPCCRRQLRCMPRSKKGKELLAAQSAG